MDKNCDFNNHDHEEQKQDAIETQGGSSTIAWFTSLNQEDTVDDKK